MIRATGDNEGECVCDLCGEVVGITRERRDDEILPDGWLQLCRPGLTAPNRRDICGINCLLTWAGLSPPEQWPYLHAQKGPSVV